jgi:hypothetical protein
MSGSASRATTLVFVCTVGLFVAGCWTGAHVDASGNLAGVIDGWGCPGVSMMPMTLDYGP